MNNLVNLLGLTIFDNVIDIPNGIETVDVDKNGDALKTYSDLVNNKLSIGIQPKGTSHEDYKKMGIIDMGKLY